MFSIWPKQPTDPLHFCVRVTKFTFLFLIPVVSAGFFVHSQWQRHSSPVKALFHVHVFVSGYLRADERGDDLHLSGVLDASYGAHFCEHDFGWREPLAQHIVLLPYGSYVWSKDESDEIYEHAASLSAIGPGPEAVVRSIYADMLSSALKLSPADWCPLPFKSEQWLPSKIE